MGERRIVIVGGGTAGMGSAIAHMLGKVDAAITIENSRRFEEYIIELRTTELPECTTSYGKQRRTKGEKRRNRAERWR